MFGVNPNAAVLGALASHQVQRHAAAEKLRQKRQAEEKGPTDAERDEPDQPVEQTEATPTLTNQLPRHPADSPTRSGEDDAGGLDVTA